MNQPSKRWEHFPRPPIVEAILFIECVPPSLFDEARITAFYEAVKQNYPQLERLEETEAAFGMSEEGITVRSVERSADQHRLVSADGRQIVQLRRRGFTVNQLAPYPGWERFVAEAKQVWQSYMNHFAVENIARLGVRYINRVELPPGDLDLSDYLQTAPAVPAALNPSIAGFFLRLVIPDDSVPATAILAQGVGPAQERGSILTIDIDVATTAIASPAGIWEMAEQLREVKNRIFFESITDTTKEMFR